MNNTFLLNLESTVLATVLSDDKPKQHKNVVPCKVLVSTCHDTHTLNIKQEYLLQFLSLNIDSDAY